MASDTPSPQHTEALLGEKLREAESLVETYDRQRDFDQRSYAEGRVSAFKETQALLAALLARDKALEEALRQADLHAEVAEILLSGQPPPDERVVGEALKSLAKLRDVLSVRGGASEPAEPDDAHYQEENYRNA